MNELIARLALLAAQGKTITYGALARDLGWRMGDLTAALEALMEQDAAMNAPLRACLCEGKLSRGLPAKGFFDKAAALGYAPLAPAEFVAQQRSAIYACAKTLPPKS